jgi:hypothetical protein
LEPIAAGDTEYVDNKKINPILLKQLTSRFELAEILNALKLNGEAAELGVHRGEFSETFLSLWNAPGRLHLIDIWDNVDIYSYNREGDLQETINKVKPFGSDRYKIIKRYTTDAALLYPNDFFDFIYLDASHTYESARRDIQMWWPLLKQGGIFAGDDYRKFYFYT